MGHHDNGHALLLIQIGQGLIEILGGGGVQPGDGFIQNQQLPCGAQRPRQQHPLLLTAGEIPVAGVLQFQNAQLTQIHHGLRPLGRGVEKVQSLSVQTAGENHLQHRGGKVPLGAGLLGQVADSAVPQRLRVFNNAGLRLKQPQKPPHQGGLAGAVVTHHAEIVSLGNGEIQAGEDGSALISQRHIPADDQFVILHGVPPDTARRFPSARCGGDQY